MSTTATALISAACAILGAIIGYVGFLRTSKQDSKDLGKEKGTILTEIGYIKAGIDDIKRKQEKQDERHLEIISRLAAVESLAKQAHSRLDRLEGRDGE
ncbi:MAG TPA: hypothetical protein DC001_06465 [Clostridiales bacterium]|jgi:hypothetical protein|nr:hypothetical protein [Clostridiales bacterium]HBR08598.1 hypothetical protein [Clostridiales bacterium]